MLGKGFPIFRLNHWELIIFKPSPNDHNGEGGVIARPPMGKRIMLIFAFGFEIIVALLNRHFV